MWNTYLQKYGNPETKQNGIGDFQGQVDSTTECNITTHQ